MRPHPHPVRHRSDTNRLLLPALTDFTEHKWLRGSRSAAARHRRTGGWRSSTPAASKGGGRAAGTRSAKGSAPTPLAPRASLAPPNTSAEPPRPQPRRTWESSVGPSSGDSISWFRARKNRCSECWNSAVSFPSYSLQQPESPRCHRARPPAPPCHPPASSLCSLVTVCHSWA